MTSSTANYLDPRTLATVGSLELRARMIVEGLMAGMHRSPYQGLSIEFAQHRQYAPGDDLRHLDWKVFGRTDKLYLKQHQQETNLDLLLLVDASGSMAYSSQQLRNFHGVPWRKFDLAASIAAALAYLALQQQDRVALTLFHDKIAQAIRPSNAKDHWRSLIDALSAQTMAMPANANPGTAVLRRTDLGKLFEQVAAQLPQRSLVVLISDLFDDPAALEKGLARLRHRRHDVILLQTLDSAELQFPFRDPSEFFGLEEEGRLNLDPLALRQAYLDSLQHHLSQVQQIARRFHYDLMTLDSSENLGTPLTRLLALRAAAIHKGRTTS